MGETLDEMLVRVREERDAKRAAEEAERDRVRAIIASFWDGELPAFDHGAYQVLDVEHVKAWRKRNNVDRPSHYGALIQELTTTVLVLYAKLAEAEAARDRAYRFVRQHPSLPDHACARCVPDGEIVIDGFVCVQHLAADAANERAGDDDE